MAKNTTISIGFSIQNGNNGLNTLVIDSKELRKAMNATVTESEKLKKGIVNLTALGNSLKNFKDSWNTIGNTLKGLTSESNSFSSAMKATNTMAGLNAEGLDALKGQVTELSKAVPIVRDGVCHNLEITTHLVLKTIFIHLFNLFHLQQPYAM